MEVVKLADRLLYSLGEKLFNVVPGFFLVFIIFFSPITILASLYIIIRVAKYKRHHTLFIWQKIVVTIAWFLLFIFLVFVIISAYYIIFSLIFPRVEMPTIKRGGGRASVSL